MDGRTRPAQTLARGVSAMGGKLGRVDVVGMILRFLIRSAGWAAVLLIINLAAPYTGVEIAISPVSVAACGALGVPGLGLVLCAAAMFV